MNAVQNFFLVCSGADRLILKRTPVEINRYVGIGATIFFTGLFAFFAGAYALYTVFDSYLVAAVFGIFWGLMIFNLDRYIVSTMRKKGQFFKDFGMVVPRLILACLIAVVIAKPLELRIFQSELEAEIALMQQENRIEQETLVKSRFEPRIENLNNEITDLKQEINTKEAHKNQLIQDALVEADGTGGSGRRNMGPIYAIKKQAADVAEQEYAQLLSSNETIIQEKMNEIEGLKGSMDETLVSLQDASYSGLAAQLHALDRLEDKSSAIFLASIFIMLLFIAVETAPIFVKLISPRSPYDYVMDKHEFKYAMNHKAIVERLENSTQNALDFEINTSRYKTKLAIDAEKQISKQALQDHLESLKSEPLVWKDLLRKGKLFQLE